MKHVTWGIILGATIAVAVGASQAAARTWNDSTGSYSIEAEMVDFADGMVRLRKTNGQTVSVALTRLSAADQEYVRLRIASTATPPAPAPFEPPPAMAATVVELLTGIEVHGVLLRMDEQFVTLRATTGTRTFTRRFPLSTIHALTIDGNRQVLNQRKPGDLTTQPAAETSSSSSVLRTPAQIEALIEQNGRTPPDWWDSVALDYPKTLDLSWPAKPTGGWNAQKNVGQYLWDVVNPNPSRWKSGVRLVHHLLDLHKNDPEKRTRAMNTLGRMYCFMLEDYARAAFWWSKAGADRDTQSPRGINLAMCYWKLGNKQMAVDLLNKLPVYFSSIKLWADMGETRKALQLAEAGARGGTPDVAYLYAGDACRMAGQFRQALQYYEKVLEVAATGKAQQRIQRNQQRARANIEAVKLFDLLDLQRVADGTYHAASPGYAGLVHVEVVVQGGRIESVRVTDHKEKQFYSAMNETPRKIIARQSVTGVDATSSATMTSEAIINATAKALVDGMK